MDGGGAGGGGGYLLYTQSIGVHSPTAPRRILESPILALSACGLVVVIDRFGQVRLLAGQVGGKSEEAEVVKRHQLVRGEREVGPEATPLNLVLISLEAQLLMLLPKLLQRGGWVGLGI